MRRSRELLFNDDTRRLELLLTPLNRLNVSIEKSFFAEAIRLAREDLRRLRLNQLQPYFYLSTGYGTVAGTASIALGFYDCDELLRGLNLELRGFQYSHYDIVNLVRQTRDHPDVYLGSSSRGALAIYRLGQARAALMGRDYVLPDDVKALAGPALGHRIIVGPAARIKDIEPEQIVQDLLDNMAVPGAHVGRQRTRA